MLGYSRKPHSVSPTLNRLGQNIQAAMAKQHVTVNQLAVNTGIPVNTIKGWLKGDNFPSTNRLSLIARELKVHQSALILGGENVE